MISAGEAASFLPRQAVHLDSGLPVSTMDDFLGEDTSLLFNSFATLACGYSLLRSNDLDTLLPLLLPVFRKILIWHMKVFITGGDIPRNKFPHLGSSFEKLRNVYIFVNQHSSHGGNKRHNLYIIILL